MSKTLTQKILEKHKDHCDIFIETGTYIAGAVDLALNLKFEKIYSIDISTKYKDELHEKYKNEINADKLKFLYGESYIELQNILQETHQPCLFWLDAHYDVHADICGKYECPILQELEVIKNSKIKNNIIFIDDVRIFKNQSHWAKNISFDSILKLLNEINPNFKFYYEDGFEPNDILIAK